MNMLAALAKDISTPGADFTNHYARCGSRAHRRIRIERARPQSIGEPTSFDITKHCLFGRLRALNCHQLNPASISPNTAPSEFDQFHQFNDFKGGFSKFGINVPGGGLVKAEQRKLPT
jgi:hypothetical protein